MGEPKPENDQAVLECSKCKAPLRVGQSCWTVAVEHVVISKPDEIDNLDESAMIFVYCEDCADQLDLHHLPEPNLK